eukprot:NODE_172_length_15988_cov_0.603940.p1 type:complete len:508 gc:universal NODE_172_length_15988_cov_0.603940:5270-6793(+)
MSRQPNDTNYQFPMPQPQQQDPSIEHQSGYSTPIQPTTQTQSTYSFTPQQSQQSINQSSNRIDIANDLDNLNLNRQISELEDFYGPYLKFNGVLNNQWYGSVMIVSRSILQLKLNTPNPLLLDPLVLYKYKDYSFQRYTFNTPLTSATKLTYSILDITYTISIPGANEPIRVLWHSCNGYSSGVDETKYPLDGLWSHVLQQHLAKPYHCQMGGGDQLYSDKVFDECRLLVDWIKIPSKRQRETYGWNNDLEQQVDEWYFHRYCKHFSRGGLSQAMAEIPYSFVLDDHDLFDGYGSYPERLQNCPIFQGVFKIAYKYYLIFQQQVQSTEMARAEGYFGEHGNSFIRHLGDKQAVLLVDTRRERTKDTVCSSSSWRKIWDALDNIPPSVQHLFVLLPVPIVYPRLKATEKGLALLSKGINGVGAIRAFTKQFQKKGVFTAMISKFGEPELLDDLCDHWTAKEHKSERKIVVETLQDFSEKHKVRVSFVGSLNNLRRWRCTLCRKREILE